MLAQRICVVCPCYNEEKGIDEFYATLKQVIETELTEYDVGMVFVDDGSRDTTLMKLKEIERCDERVMVYGLSRNFGHQIALSAGLDHAHADAVIMMDADLQHPPDCIPQLVAQWEKGAEVVLAVRKSTEGTSFLKNVTSNGFYTLFNYLSDVKLTPGVADFCLLSRAAHAALKHMPERHRFLRGMVAWMGFNRAYVEYAAPRRPAGKSSYTLRRMIALALSAIISFSVRPMRIATNVGACVLLLGIFYVAYICLRLLVFGDLVPGWASIICTVVIIGGAQIMFTGIVGEYLMRIFEETKGRPLYIIRYLSIRHTELSVPPLSEKNTILQCGR